MFYRNRLSRIASAATAVFVTACGYTAEQDSGLKFDSTPDVYERDADPAMGRLIEVPEGRVKSTLGASFFANSAQEFKDEERQDEENEFIVPSAFPSDQPRFVQLPRVRARGGVTYGWEPWYNGIIVNAIREDKSTLLNKDFLSKTVMRKRAKGMAADFLPANAMADLKTICPGFPQATSDEQMAVWSLFFASIAHYESGFDNSNSFLEAWGDKSIGLLQLSYVDQKIHKECRIDPTANNGKGNITDPAVNLHCGVIIMRDQIAKTGSLFPKEKPYYWSVLTRNPTQQKLINYFLKYADQQLPICKGGVSPSPIADLKPVAPN